jgi:hypothetical protein
MNRVSVTDILAALRHTDPDVLAAAIYADNDPDLLSALAHTLGQAAERTATYPHPEVIAEGDAVLHEVLRWPVADALPPGHLPPSAGELSAARHMPLVEAERLLHRIAATELVAARQLIDSGIHIDFTLEQAQVSQCIADLVRLDITPTRQTVRAHAHALAAAAGPDEHPIIPNTNGLPPRVMSPSPMTVVPAWLDRMDADPPLTGMLDTRLDYLRAAITAMGRAARQHTTALTLLDTIRARPALAPPAEHYRPSASTLRADSSHRMAV